MRFVGMYIAESGERHAFNLTSDDFQPGSWRLNRFSDVVPDNDILKGYRTRGWEEKAWEFTVQIWERAIDRSSAA